MTREGWFPASANQLTVRMSLEDSKNPKYCEICDDLMKPPDIVLKFDLSHIDDNEIKDQEQQQKTQKQQSQTYARKNKEQQQNRDQCEQEQEKKVQTKSQKAKKPQNKDQSLFSLQTKKFIGQQVPQISCLQNNIQTKSGRDYLGLMKKF